MTRGTQAHLEFNSVGDYICNSITYFVSQGRSEGKVPILDVNEAVFLDAAEWRMSNVSQNRADSAATERPSARLAWTPPVLREIGSVAETTRKVTTSGRNDGGSGTKRRS